MPGIATARLVLVSEQAALGSAPHAHNSTNNGDTRREYSSKLVNRNRVIVGVLVERLRKVVSRSCAMLCVDWQLASGPRRSGRFRPCGQRWR